MNRKSIALLAAAAIVAAGVAAGGCASAATTSHAAPAKAATGTAATAATARTKGTAHILIYSISSDGPRFKEIATGAIGDYGPGVTVNPNGTVDPEHHSQLELTMSHGSFRLSISMLHKDLIKAFGHWPGNPATCSGSISFTAPVPVVPGTGTGVYRGITGAFKMTVTIAEVDVKPVCDGTSGFLSQVILMDGAGTVSY